MAVELVQRNFVIDNEVIQFRIGQYDCRIVFGNRYAGISSEEPHHIEVLIEIPQEDRYFSIYEKPFDTFLYKNNLYKVDTKDGYTEDEMKLLIKHHYYKNREKLEKIQKERIIKLKKIQKEIELFESVDKKRTHNNV